MQKRKTHNPDFAGLYTAVVADALDGLGYRNQCLPATIRALTGARRVAGRVFTARARAVDETSNEPYKLEIAAVDAMSAGDVFVVDAGFDTSCGFWGELLTTACLAKGVCGVVMTACTRDLWRLEEAGFPVFGIGMHPADSLGRMDIEEIGVPIEIGGVGMETGDWILGDVDGVVVIPDAVANEALRRSREKVGGENEVRDTLLAGEPMGEVFARYGIL